MMMSVNWKRNKWVDNAIEITYCDRQQIIANKYAIIW